MSQALVVVESAAKAKTIEKFLGPSYTVMASGGHVRDLPSRGLSVDIDNGFRARFEVVPDRKKILDALKRKAKKASRIYLATDPDREGEAISQDLETEFRSALGRRRNVPVQRITFHEITRPAVRRAIEEAGEIDRTKVNAQQTRRVLDRIVGYKISPLLSRKMAPRLSAGRVQSVALRLICAREREVRAFDIEEYWRIEARLRTEAGKPVVALADIPRALPKKPAVREEKVALEIRKVLEGCRFEVGPVTSKRRLDHAPPPFITSTMQRQASSAFRFPAARTMRTAQSLYEGVNLGSGERVGLITYLRTDSTRISKEALVEVRGLIGDQFGKDFLPDRPNFYRKGRRAQDAHEAIRPTSVRRHPDAVARFLNEDQRKVYRMIWERFVASQMTSAEWLDTKASFTAIPRDGGAMPEVAGFGTAPERFSASGSVLDRPGYRILYREVRDNAGKTRRAKDRKRPVLPPLREGQAMNLDGIDPVRRFTSPPRRYSEAALIQKLEHNGIGRPSTYVPTLRKIKDREYVRMKNRVFVPTEVGMLVSDLLAITFDDLFNVRYTAAMEANLDRIEQGEATYQDTLSAFWRDFSADLERATMEMPRVKGLPTSEPCGECEKPMLLRWANGEKFLGCSQYPECRGSRSLAEEEVGPREEEVPVCPECEAPMAARRGRFGTFLGCTRYPVCSKIIPIRNGRLVAPRPPPEPVNEDCPTCGKGLVKRQSRRGPFIGCSGFPKCRYIKPRPPGARGAKKKWAARKKAAARPARRTRAEA